MKKVSDNNEKEPAWISLPNIPFLKVGDIVRPVKNPSHLYRVMETFDESVLVCVLSQISRPEGWEVIDYLISRSETCQPVKAKRKSQHKPQQ